MVRYIEDTDHKIEIESFTSFIADSLDIDISASRDGERILIDGKNIHLLPDRIRYGPSQIIEMKELQRVQMKEKNNEKESQVVPQPRKSLSPNKSSAPKAKAKEPEIVKFPCQFPAIAKYIALQIQQKHKVCCIVDGKYVWIPGAHVNNLLPIVINLSANVKSEVLSNQFSSYAEATKFDREFKALELNSSMEFLVLSTVANGKTKWVCTLVAPSDLFSSIRDRIFSAIDRFSTGALSAPPLM